MRKYTLVFLLINVFIQTSSFADFCAIKSVVRDANKSIIERTNHLVDIEKSTKFDFHLKDFDVILKFSKLGKIRPLVETNLKNSKISSIRVNKYGQRYVIVKTLGVIPVSYLGIIKKKYLESTLECPII